MAKANPPVRHHFVPEFYQRRWAGDDRRIERYQRFDNNVARHRVFPAASGYRKNLYRHPRAEMDEWSAQMAEWAVFQVIDSYAAAALDALLSDRNAIRNDEVRSHWAVFLRTMLMRTPYQMQAVLASLEKIWREADVSEKYDKMRKPGMPKSANEFLEMLNPDAAKESAFGMFVDAMGRDKTTRYITSLPWRIVDCSEASHQLLLSDHPVVLVPLQTDNGHIAMPLSPTKILLAAGNGGVKSRANAMKVRDSVHAMNRLTVRRATECVIATNRSQEKFIKRHFGVEPMPPFLSPSKLG